MQQTVHVIGYAIEMRIVVPKSSVNPAPPPGSSQNSSGIRISTVQNETTNRVVNRVPDPDSGNQSPASATPNNDNHVNNVSNNQNLIHGNTSVAPAGRHVKKMRKTQNNNNANNVDDGYNSEEEQRLKRASLLDKIRTIEDVKKLIMDSEEEMRIFSEDLKREKGFIIKPMAADGNCLFRSIADQIYGDQDMQDQVRERCMNYIEAERDHYSQFVTEDFSQYIARKRRDKCYGNNLEIQAMGELYNRPIQIFTYNNGTLQEPINIFHEDYVTDNPPIRLSYHNGNHYNSVIDPNNPTVGVGLGLPNFQPGVGSIMNKCIDSISWQTRCK